ncbi:S8 family peptidase [Streptomyces sp. McG3]|uniref:S8 family peptidase n=1 Tax=Streptomyces sp. McG3 TaxID=2725483 RepID=UPI0027E49C6A|nr:S8 family peptidase [Streptomyces sp. McG3]
MKRTIRKAIIVSAAGSVLLALAATGPLAVASPAAVPDVTDATAAGRVIVSYKASAAEARSDKAAAADTTDKAQDVDQRLRFQGRAPTGDVVINLGGRQSRAEVAEVLAEYRSDPSVAFVAPELVMKSMAEGGDPSDTRYGEQWDLFEPVGGMNVPAAWAKSTGQGTNVAVIDTGYVRHSDLGANVRGGHDFISSAASARDGDGGDSNPNDEGTWGSAQECGTKTDVKSSWHGTHVAGTIAAIADNGKGIAGVAHQAKILPVRALGKCGSGGSLDIAIGIQYAAGVPMTNFPTSPDPAEVINLSLGGASKTCPWYYQNAIDKAVARGTTVVVAAGNSNEDVSGHTPANCNNVITVASTNRQGDRAFYSNFGAKVDVAAPGGEVRRAEDAPGTVTTPENGILSTVNTSQAGPTGRESYAPMMGTSMAAPHIAGLAALLKSADPGLSPARIETLIKGNARSLPGTCTGGCGAGIADSTKTLAALSSSSEGLRD